MIDGAVAILEEHAAAVQFFGRGVDYLKVVIDLALGQILFLERDVVVVVEIAAKGGNPVEAPPHPFFVSLDFRQRCARNRKESDVVMCEMEVGPVDMIGKKRAAYAPGLAPGPEHEVIHDELAAAVE